ncbi:MAG: YceI family protein [Aliarcobacter sp.]|nr:YceI family protein [Aliarcobacter sp.]
MKRKLSLSILGLFLVSGLNAYEINGDLGVKWTGFKTEKKVPVSGTFNEINLDIKSSEKLDEFLKSAKVKINSLSLESKDEGRNISMISTLFSLASAKEIKGAITQVNESEKTLLLDVTMNEITKAIPMTYEIVDGNIIAKGAIEILDFNLKGSFLEFAKVCAVHHENKSFSNVDIAFTIPFK